MKQFKKATHALTSARNYINQLCDMVNTLHKSNGGKGIKVRAEDFLEPISKLDSIVSKEGETPDTEKEPVTNPTMRARTWSNQYPNSLNDLDLSFFNLNNKEHTQPSWDDVSNRNDLCASFSVANGKKEGLLLFLDHNHPQDRNSESSARFYLRSFPRVDDGTTDDYELDQGTGDDVLYDGSDFELLKKIIKANAIM